METVPNISVPIDSKNKSQTSYGLGFFFPNPIGAANGQTKESSNQ
jgi:hypothetical protein